MTLPAAPDGYPAWLADLKTRIREARLRASLAVNSELIGLYWRIGRDILERQGTHGWGAKVVDRSTRPPANATSNARSSPASRICCWSSARASLSLPTNTISRSAIRTSTSTCCSITASCAAWSRSISSSDPSCRSTPAR